MRWSSLSCRSGFSGGLFARAAWLASTGLIGWICPNTAWAVDDAGAIDEGTNSSLSTYRGTMASGHPSTGALATGQGIRPLYSQRAYAVGFGGGEVDSTIRDVDLFTLSARLGEVDLSFPTNGPGVVISRSYNGAQDNSGAYSNDGYQGYNWFQGARPELIKGTAFSGTDMLYLVVGATRVMEFRLVGNSTTLFAGVNGTLAAATIVADGSGDPGVIEVRDTSGRVMTFFDFDGDAQGAQGQLWKVTDEDGNGNVSYVGTSLSKSAGLNGFIKDSGTSTARVTNIVDGSDRNFEFAYTTVGGSPRLTSVIAYTKTGGTWASSPTGVAEVGRVDYEYYSSDSSGVGKTGDLKFVTVSMPLSSNGPLVRKTYYRYTTGSGQEHLVKYVVSPEGNRRYGGDISGQSDGTLDSYASHKFTYDSGVRTIATATFNGECGCGGSGANGTHTLSLETNVSFSGSLTDDTYGSSGGWTNYQWYKRAIITTADSHQYAIYFDEVAQQLGKVYAHSSLSTGSTFTVTKIERDSSGRVVKVLTPAAVSAYTHAAVGVTPGGILTAHTAGHVAQRTYPSSGEYRAGVEKMQISNGGGTATDKAQTSYASGGVKSLTDGSETVTLTRLLPASTVLYSGTTDTTSYTRTFYSGASSWAPKKTEVELPSLSGGDTSGPGSIIRETYQDTKGRTIFTKDGAGRITFFKYNSYGQVTKRIDDPTSDTGYDSDATTAAGTYSLTLNGYGLNYATTYTYDAQGRVLTTTHPTGRISATHYTQLADGRMVTLSVGHQSGGDSYGPVSYSVTNAAGKSEAQGTIALTGGTSSVAMSGWLDTSKLDVIEAVSYGSDGVVAHLTTSTYDYTGAHLQTSTLFNAIPSSVSGATSGQIEVTTYGYDAMGRTRRVVDPTSTISYSKFDYLGRVYERWMGTNDTGYAGSSMSGSPNMVQVESVTYTANNLIAARTTHVNTSSGDDRTTTYTYDFRDRLIVTTNPQPPHNVMKYDNANRAVAVGSYSSSSNISVSTDPTSSATDRVALSETVYNTRGQVRESKRHKVDPADGSLDDNISSYSWYDGAGRVIKSRGEQLTKTFFDTMGRATHSFVLATDNDSTNDHAKDVAGDTVLEERQTLYDNSGDKGLVLMSVAISRHPGDTSTTGALDAVLSGADPDGINIVNMGSSSFKGRCQITSYYYDTHDRQTDVVFLGTNGGTTYTRSSDTSAGTRSATRLINSTIYDDDGTVLSTVDAKGIATVTEYDAARRTTKTIHNYANGTPGGGTNGDEDQVTEYTYTNGLMTALAARMPSSGDDQVTTYNYDFSASGMMSADIKSKRLLYSVQYPDSSGGTDRVFYQYNRAGQQIGMIDQAGNQIDTTYDTGGREIKRTVTTLAGGFDGSVRRIEMAYLTRGPIDTVTQYDATTSGTATDQVMYEYDEWGNLQYFRQDVDSTMVASGGTKGASTGGRGSFAVEYDYTKSTPSGGVNSIRRTQQTSYKATTIFAATQYDYGTSSAMNDMMSRVQAVKASPDGSTFTTVATYEYLGSRQLVGTTLNQASLETKLTDGSGTSTTYDDMDNFGRPETWDWKRSGGAALYDVDITYDQNSNPTSTADNVHVRDSSGNRLFDVLYGLDNLNRVISAEEGTLSGTISNRTSKEAWTLSQTGNWTGNTRDNDGVLVGGLFVDEENYGSTTFNKANEWTARTDSAGSFTENMTYDNNGNMTTWGFRGGDGQKYTYVYDAFGRLKKVQTNLSGFSPADHTVYRYNGLGFRIMWQHDADLSFTTLNDSERYYFMYDERWRIIGTFRDQDTSPKESFVYHGAGKAGRGGASYIDSVILRDRDASNQWSSASDGTLEERRFYCQNWRADVVAITKSDGLPWEFVRYTSYGRAQVFAAADVNRDGIVNAGDAEDWDDLYTENPSAAAIPVDFNFDGSSFDPDDYDDFNALYSLQSGFSNGGQVSSLGNRKGYAGYEFDQPVEAYHVRHRVYLPEVGRWTKRDPIRYRAGMNLLGYVGAQALIDIDPTGLAGVPLAYIGSSRASTAGFFMYGSWAMASWPPVPQPGIPEPNPEVPEEPAKETPKDPRSDPKTNPDDWTPNDDKGQPGSLGNCWRYATCQPLDEMIRRGPGRWIGDVPAHQTTPGGENCEQVMANAAAARCMGPANAEGGCDSGYRVGALSSTSHPGQTHYIRQDIDGTWTHKIGTNDETNLDCGNPRAIIVDPAQANWNCQDNHSRGANYEFCGYVCRLACD